MKKIGYFIVLLFLMFSVVSAKSTEKKSFTIIDNSLIMDIVETSDSGYFAVGGAMPTDENKWPFPARYAV